MPYMPTDSRKAFGDDPHQPKLRHPTSSLPLLPSGPDGIHDWSSRRSRCGPPKPQTQCPCGTHRFTSTSYRPLPTAAAWGGDPTTQIPLMGRPVCSANPQPILIVRRRTGMSRRRLLPPGYREVTNSLLHAPLPHLSMPQGCVLRAAWEAPHDRRP